MSDNNRRRTAVSFIIKSRTDRNKFFRAQLFSDIAWDILLVVYAGQLDGQEVPVSKLADAANVNVSTVQRWLAALEVEGLVLSRPYGSGDCVELSDKGWLAMDSYFESIFSGES